MVAKPTFVGIDVSKRQLDVAIRPTGEVFSLNNDEAGISSYIPCGEDDSRCLREKAPILGVGYSLPTSALNGENAGENKKWLAFIG